jgi:hypothetical protein
MRQKSSSTTNSTTALVKSLNEFYFVFLIEHFACLCFKGDATFDAVLLATILAPLAGAGAADFANDAGAVKAIAPSTTKDTSVLFMIGSPSVFWYSQ